MNKWECAATHCDRHVVGLGGAVGLRAIGWYFERGTSEPLTGATVYCPAHHPYASLECRHEKRCAVCVETERLQHLVDASSDARPA